MNFISIAESSGIPALRPSGYSRLSQYIALSWIIPFGHEAVHSTYIQNYQGLINRVGLIGVLRF